ncbi:hypothetical protein JCM30566_03000 [Marinitoga arctica]
MKDFHVFLRESIFGKEYLNIIDNKTFRVRITKSESFYYNYFLKISKELEFFKEFGLLIPEKIEIKEDNYYIYTEYWNEIPITECEIDEKKYYYILYTVYDIIDRITHSANIIIPYICLDDIYIDENNKVTMMPFFFVPQKNEKIIINEKNDEDGVIEILKKLAIKLYRVSSRKTYRMKKFLDLINKDIECVHDLYMILLNVFNFYKKSYERIRIPHFIDRENERDKILKILGKKHIFIYGPQRVGKTRLIDFMEFKFKELNYTVIRSRSIKEIFSGTIDIPRSLNIFYFLSYIDTLRENKKDFKLIIIVDDYQDIDIKFKNFVEEILSKNFDFPFSIILISHLYQKLNVDNIEYIELKPFQKEKTEILLKIILSNEFLIKYPEIIEIVHDLSKGYPGDIYQIIKDFYDLGIIKFENEHYLFYPEKIKDKKIIDLVYEKILKIPSEIKEDLKYLSTLGFKFKISDINILEGYLKRNFDTSILYAIEKNILLKENNEYRFFNLFYQDLFHNLLSPTEKRNIHIYLSRKYETLKEKIFHLKNAGKIKAVISIILKEMKKSLFYWKDLNFIDYGFHEIEKLIDKIPYSAMAIYLSKKYFLNEYSKDLEKYIKEIKASSVYGYIADLFLKYTDEKKLNDLLLGWINDEKTTDYKKGIYIYFYLSMNYSKLEKDKIFEFYLIFEKIFEKHKNLSKFKTIHGMILNILGIKMETAMPELSLKYYNEALNISIETNYKRLTQIVYANLAIIYESLNSSISEIYNKKVLELSKEIGDYHTYNRILINIANTKLYKGEISEFFELISKAEKYSLVNNDFNSYLLANDIKNYYFLYGRDYSNLESNIRKIDDYVKDKVFLKNTLKDLKDNIYILKAFFEKNKFFFQNKKYKKIIEKNDFFKNLYTLLFESDENKIYISWLFYKNNPLVYLKEEMVYIVSEKIAKYKFSDEFEKWSISLIKEFKDKKLSLAILFEGLGYFYNIKREKFKSLKYLRKAQKIYEELFMKNKFKEINDFLINKFKLPSFIYKEFSFNKINFESNYNDLFERIKSYEKINSLIIDLLRSTSPKFVVDKIGDFIKNTYPANEILIRVITKDYEVEYNFNFNNEEDLEKDQFLIKPLKLSYSSNYDDYKYYIYMGNKNVELDSKDAANILDNIIIIEDVLFSILDKITHYEYSILDPLTSAYTRRYMENKLKELYGLYERYKFDFSVILIDIDDFKKVNDKYGHQKGDEILVELVNSLKGNLRDFDIVCRYGGEEFLTILPNTDLKGAEKIAKRLLKNVNITLFKKTKLNITVSMGISSINMIKKDPKIENLIKIADKALYKAKTNGKNRVEVI